MPTLESLLTTSGLVINVVVQIGDTYWADKTPDSDPGGLITQTVGLLGNLDLPSAEIDILRGDVAVPSMTFQLADTLAEVTEWYGLQNNDIYGEQVTVWAGATGQSMAFPADYTQLAIGRISKAVKEAAVWEFSCVDVLDKVNVEAFQTKTAFNGDHDDAVTTWTVLDTTDFPSSGYLKAGSEFVSYSGKTSTTVTGVTRAQLLSEASDHDSGEEIIVVKELIGNPLELALQLLVSSGGGGSYDVLTDGAGIDEDLVDVEAFEAYVSEFADFGMTIYLTEIGSVLNLLSQEILLPYGLRIISREGLVSVAKIESFDPTVDFLTIDEDTISGIPTLSIDSDEIVNDMLFKWNWRPGNEEFQNRVQYTSSDSQTKYGARPQHEFEFHSLIANADTLFARTQSKFLARFGEPVGLIEAEVDRPGFLSDPGDDVRVVHENLPKMGAGLGHDAFMELVGITRRQTGFVTMRLQYASYSNLRMGLIAPSPMIQGVIIHETATSIFTVESGEGKFYREGFFVRLWTDGTGYEAGVPRAITAIGADTIAVTPGFTTTPTSAMRLKFANYDDCTVLQRVMFAFVSGNNETVVQHTTDAGAVADVEHTEDDGSTVSDVMYYDPDGPGAEFSDGLPAYQIVP